MEPKLSWPPLLCGSMQTMPHRPPPLWICRASPGLCRQCPGIPCWVSWTWDGFPRALRSQFELIFYTNNKIATDRAWFSSASGRGHSPCPPSSSSSSSSSSSFRSSRMRLSRSSRSPLAQAGSHSGATAGMWRLLGCRTLGRWFCCSWGAHVGRPRHVGLWGGRGSEPSPGAGGHGVLWGSGRGCATGSR